MRIGGTDIFLVIEISSLDDGYTVIRAEAAAAVSGRRFTASHDGLMMFHDEETRRQFTDFESLKSQRVELSFSEEGWLRLQRNSRGGIAVQYRIGGWKASAAMEGEILVDGEFSGNLCRELSALLDGQKPSLATSAKQQS